MGVRGRVILKNYAEVYRPENKTWRTVECTITTQYVDLTMIKAPLKEIEDVEIVNVGKFKAIRLKFRGKDTIFRFHEKLQGHTT